MTETESTNTIQQAKSRFGEQTGYSESGFLVNAAAFIKSNFAEISFCSCCVLAFASAGVIFTAVLGHAVSAETDAMIAQRKLNESLQQLKMILMFYPQSDAVRLSRARVLIKLKRKQDALVDLDIILKHDSNNIDALERRSSLFITLEQWDKALADCNKLVELQKDHASVYTYGNRAIASAMLGKNREALDYFSTAIRMNPSDSSLFLGRASVHRQMHRYPEAKEDLEWVAMLSPGNVDGLIMQSQIYALEKNYPEALARLNEAIKANPKISKLYLERGRLIWGRTHSKEALADFAKAVALDSKNNDALLESMRANLFLRNDNEALKLANLLAMNGFRTYEIQMTRADLQTAQKRFGIAELGYENAAALKPKEVEPLVKRARILAVRKKFDLAADLLTMALKIRPADPNLLLARGDYFRQAKEFEKAQSDFEKAFALKPDLMAAHMGLGQNYCDQQDYKKAKTEFEIVLRANPKATDAQNFLAFTKRGLTDFGRLRSVSTSSEASDSGSALDARTKALVASGSFDDVLKEGVSRYNSGSYNAAISLLSKAVKLKPNVASTRRYLAKALIASGYTVDGVAQYRTVIEQEPGNVDDLATLAKACTDSRQYEDAIDIYGKLLDVKPHDLEATCGLIQSYKSAGLPKKAQEICRTAIRSANGMSEIARYEALLNSLSTGRDVVPKRPTVVPQSPANIQG